jgi:hypothetical protein
MLLHHRLTKNVYTRYIVHDWFSIDSGIPYCTCFTSKVLYLVLVVHEYTEVISLQSTPSHNYRNKGLSKGICRLITYHSGKQSDQPNSLCQYFVLALI